jgi:molybdopterin-guanine dinucleotide biosynthesis protein A
MIDDIPSIILSGGKSSRMGEDKSLLPFGNFKTLIEYQYNKFSKIFKKVYISAKTNKFDFEANLILDIDKNISSPMVALQSIFSTLQSEKVFIIAVDTPLVQELTIRTLVIQSTNRDITIASDQDKRHNLCGVFSNQIINTINILLDKDIHAINHLIRKTNNNNEVYFNNKNQFININTISDYKRAIL